VGVIRRSFAAYFAGAALVDGFTANRVVYDECLVLIGDAQNLFADVGVFGPVRQIAQPGGLKIAQLGVIRI